MLLFSALLCHVLGQGPKGDTPGFAFLGNGYDVLSGNPLSTSGLGDPGFRYDIFDWQYTQGLATTDGKYRIADKTHSRTFDACSSTMDQTIYNSAYSYKHLIDTSFDIDLNLGFKGSDNVDFEFGVDVRNTRNHTDTRSRIYAHVTAVCTRYQLQMNLFDQANLTDDFQQGVAEMPVEFDMNTYAEFLTAFGTHYVSSMKVGGRWGMQMSFKSDSYQALLDHNVNVHAGITFVAGTINGGVHINSTNDRRTTYEIASAIWKNSTFSIGGDYSSDPTVWMNSVTATPMPVHLTLTRLDHLFNQWQLPKENPTDLVKKRANVVTAINGWCAYHMTLTPGFNCTPQQAIPMPTPSPIEGDAIRRVCVANSGGFLLYWHMMIGNTTGAQTGSYSDGNTECIDGTDVYAKFGQDLGCKVNIVGHVGGPIMCGKPWKQFNLESTYQANYKCTGIATTPICVFNGVSRIGGEGGGR